MNKQNLVTAIATGASITKKAAELALNTVLDKITSAVSAGEDVTLVGFGTFVARERAAREGRNPQTGQKIKIGATRVPTFRAGKLFKEQVKSGKAHKPAAKVAAAKKK